MTDADHFHPDVDLNDQRKLARERHFHVVEIPILRLLGFLIVTILAFIHQAFVPGEPSGSPLTARRRGRFLQSGVVGGPL